MASLGGECRTMYTIRSWGKASCIASARGAAFVERAPWRTGWQRTATSAPTLLLLRDRASRRVSNDSQRKVGHLPLEQMDE